MELHSAETARSAVQSVGPGGGGGAVRFVGNAALCRHRRRSRAGARRDDGVPLRHLLEAHDLGQQLFDEMQRHLASKGLKVATGTIVDATIINAPSSTKNADKARDPEMHQTKKGNQWYFGMKAHFGIDSRTKLIHAVVATPANVADSTVLPELLHGRETRVWGDQAYRGPGRGDPATRPQGQRLHQPPLSPARRGRPGRAQKEPHQVEGKGPGRGFDRVARSVPDTTLPPPSHR